MVPTASCSVFALPTLRRSAAAASWAGVSMADEKKEGEGHSGIAGGRSVILAPSPCVPLCSPMESLRERLSVAATLPEDAARAIAELRAGAEKS